MTELQPISQSVKVSTENYQVFYDQHTAALFISEADKDSFETETPSVLHHSLEALLS